MSSTPDPNAADRPHNPTHFGGEGLYESTGMEEESSLKVRLGEQLDSATRRSLQMAQSSTNSAVEFVRRNPVPVVLAIAGVALLVAAMSWRRSAHE